jgi:hypothetical protein
VRAPILVASHCDADEIVIDVVEKGSDLTGTTVDTPVLIEAQTRSVLC